MSIALWKYPIARLSIVLSISCSTCFRSIAGAGEDEVADDDESRGAAEGERSDDLNLDGIGVVGSRSVELFDSDSGCVNASNKLIEPPRAD